MQGNLIKGGGTVFRARELFPDGEYPRKVEDLVIAYEMCYGVRLVEQAHADGKSRFLFVSPDQRYMLARYNWSEQDKKGFRFRRTEQEMDDWINGFCTTFNHWWFRTTGEFVTGTDHRTTAENILKEKLK